MAKHLRLFIVLLCCITLFITGCHSNMTIVTSIPEKEANEIVVLLASRGIPAEKMAAPTSAVGGTQTQTLWNIAVPSTNLTESLAILNQAGLPRAKGTSLLDLFGTQGLVPSDLQDRIRYQEGLSEQLASTIRKMDGIIDANVQITFPQDDSPSKVLTASVYIKHRGILDNQNSLLINKIKRLVSSAIPGLSIENVSVVADRALFSDVNLPQSQANAEENREYVSIWSITVAKESASRFRLIFYFFIILLFLLAATLLWILWKFYPLLERRGGWKALFEAKPLEENPQIDEGIPPPKEE